MTSIKNFKIVEYKAVFTTTTIEDFEQAVAALLIKNWEPYGYPDINCLTPTEVHCIQIMILRSKRHCA